MYEILVMPLTNYWAQMGDFGGEIEQTVGELQDVLSEHFGKKISWDDNPKSFEEAEERIDIIDENQLCSLHAVAAKWEVDRKLDGFELDADEPWYSEAFSALEAKLEDSELEVFPQFLAIENTPENFVIPCEFDNVATLQLNDSEEEPVESEKCGCGETDCSECFPSDDGAVDVVSLPALRRELDLLGEILNLDKDVSVDALNVEKLCGDVVDPLRHAKLCWYILNERVNEALRYQVPLIMRWVDDDVLAEYREEFEEFERLEALELENE